MLKILIADDSLPSLAACQAMLEKMGHHIAVAHNGEEAHEKAQCQAFDLIILDEYMPGIGGAQVAQLLRRTANPNALTPIVSLSGVTSENLKRQMLDCGVDGHLTKPVSSVNLQAMLQQYVPGKASILDVNIIESMKVDVGEECQHRLLQLFAEELQMLSARLEKAVAEKSRADISAVTHIWKNSAALYGAENLADLARQLNEVPPEVDEALVESAENVLTVAKDTWNRVNQLLVAQSA